MTEAIFRSEHGTLVPGPDSCGPWSRERMHGGPVFGVIARAVEAAAPDPELVACRFTFDLSRSVPLIPLEVSTHIAQQSSRLCLIRVSLRAAGEEFVSASALLLRGGESDESFYEAHQPAGPDGLETQSLFAGATRLAQAPSGPGYHVRVETRWMPREAGAPLSIWFRMPLPLVAGEATTPLQRAVQLSDFANAVASIALRDRGGMATPFINVDATIHLTRRPAGEWFCIQSRSIEVERGISVASCSLYDERGHIGYVTQSRLLNRTRR